MYRKDIPDYITLLRTVMQHKIFVDFMKSDGDKFLELALKTVDAIFKEKNYSKMT